MKVAIERTTNNYKTNSFAGPQSMMLLKAWLFDLMDSDWIQAEDAKTVIKLANLGYQGTKLRFDEQGLSITVEIPE